MSAAVHDRALRVVLGLMAVSGFGIGGWALVAPHSFYDDFPGGGRHWVSADGPFNEHLLRDFGGLNLGLAVVALVAAVTVGRVVAQAAAVGALAYDVPHLVYHLLNLQHYGTSDKVANVAALVLTALLPVAVLVLASGRRHNVSP